MNHSAVQVSPEDAASMLVAEVAAGRMTPVAADDHCRCMAREALMAVVDDHAVERALDNGDPHALDGLDSDVRDKAVKTMAAFVRLGLALGKKLRDRGLVGCGPELN